MIPADQDRLAEFVRPFVTAAGLDLEHVSVATVGRRNVVRIVVDGNEGVGLDAAAEVSRAVAAGLDRDGDAVLGSDPYTLEVSSPGIGRPLTEERHFRRARGRLVSIVADDGSTIEGRIRRVDDGMLELLTDAASTASTFVRLDTIRKAKVQVEFGAMPAAHAALLAEDGFVDPARTKEVDESADEDDEDAESDSPDDEAEESSEADNAADEEGNNQNVADRAAGAAADAHNQERRSP